MKRMYYIALLLSVSFSGFAQMKTPEQAVVDAHKAFVESVKKGLIDKKAIKPEFGNLKSGDQFMLREDEKTLNAFSIDTKKTFLKKIINGVEKFIGIQKTGVEIVFDKLRGYVKEERAYKSPKPVQCKNADVEKLSKKDKKFTTVYYETTDEIYTRAEREGFVSDVEYTVTFGWKVNLTDDSVRTDKKNDVQLISVKAKRNPYTHNELASMKAMAQKAISNWYAELPNNLDKKYADEAIGLAAMKVAESEIKGSLDKQSFVSKDVPKIEINIHFEVAPEEVAFYDANPMSYYTLSPKFTVTINDDLKTAQVTNVDYTKGEIKNPLPNGEKEKRSAAAHIVAQNFANQLSAYVINPTDENRTKLKEMFVDNNATVEVSNISKQGKERIEIRSVEKYFSRLKAKEIVIKLEHPVEIGNLEIIECPIDQDYFSKTYSDNTDKVLFLKYNNGSYLIEKIMVKPGSTILK
ncbi:MAG: hypothetical protein LBM25_06240 [Bacteroidales bacterium]|jgi:hypothetical protein|nr:hypothetical protein [Bacteroidales bacterium]